MVVTGAIDDITQQNYKYVFRMNPTNAYYASGMMSFLKEVVKPKSMAVLYESSDFGTSGAEEMVKQCAKIGVKVLMKEKYERGAVDFKPILSKVKAAKPDVIYMVSYVMDASLLMKQIKELRIDAKLFAGGAAGFAIPEFIRECERCGRICGHGNTLESAGQVSGSQGVCRKIQEDVQGLSLLSWRRSLFRPLHSSKMSSKGPRHGLPTTSAIAMKATNMVTAFGPIKFEDKEGYTNQNFMDTLVMQVINGQHETIWPEKYASKKYLFPIPRWRDRKIESPAKDDRWLCPR